MLELFRRLIADRRKKKEVVVVERRHRVASRAADKQLYDSIDRFCEVTARARAQMPK